jgi:hypothetical protein
MTLFNDSTGTMNDGDLAPSAPPVRHPLSIINSNAGFLQPLDTGIRNNETLIIVLVVIVGIVFWLSSRKDKK